MTRVWRWDTATLQSASCTFDHYHVLQLITQTLLLERVWSDFWFNSRLRDPARLSGLLNRAASFIKQGTGHPCSVAKATSVFNTSKYLQISTLLHSTLTFWPRGVTVVLLSDWRVWCGCGWCRGLDIFSVILHPVPIHHRTPCALHIGCKTDQHSAFLSVIKIRVWTCEKHVDKRSRTSYCDIYMRTVKPTDVGWKNDKKLQKRLLNVSVTC